jgi:phosphopantothenoylcysteine decarboxylase/phosphopantothenate--cysteine ligase
MTLLCDTLVLGVTGSIAAAEAPLLVRRLRDEVCRDVHVIVTPAARRFVSRRALELYSGQPVWSDLFDTTPSIRVAHVELAQRANLLLVAPATANLLAKCAHGLCDDLLSTTIVATRAPVVLAPNMNQAMWTSRVVRRNVALVRELGHFVVEPTWGYEIADGLPTFGTMPPFRELQKAMAEALSSSGSTRPT